MKTIQAYLNGYKTAWKSKKLISTVYLFYLTIALLIAIPFYRLFVSISGNSLLPDELLHGFDMTVLADLIRDGGKVFLVYLKGAWPWVIAFLILGTWMAGGIINWISAPRGKFRLGVFFTANNKYFWRFLRVAAYALALQLIIGFLVYVIPVILISKDGLTDQYIVRTLGITIAIHLLIVILISLIADFTRFRLFHEASNKVLKVGWKSAGFVIRKVLSLYLLYLMWLIIPIVLIIAFYLFRVDMQIDTIGLVAIVFILQQVFIWIRYFTRIQRLAMYYKYKY
ncbi:MAG: hypothetical protein J7L96_01490 [Bacteroidales bacterium]|nr:hypothetical protein [Bacteroidales bacterium]